MMKLLLLLLPSISAFIAPFLAVGNNVATSAAASPRNPTSLANSYLDSLSLQTPTQDAPVASVAPPTATAPIASVRVAPPTAAATPPSTPQQQVAATPTSTPHTHSSSSAGYRAPSSAALGDFLVQRAIQQQLFYNAQLGNEPMVHWLKSFRSHEHLDSSQRSEGRCGFPGTYSAAFDQLNTLPFTAYLEAMGTEPDSSIEVNFVKPQRRLSARERANPFLNNQQPVIEVYDQPIIMSKILTLFLNTADALVETWAFHFNEAESNDLLRVANDRAEFKGLPSSLMRENAALEKGGETAYSRLTGDEAMPLYGFDCRACDRFDMLRALSLLVDEVTALTPETAFTVDYLRPEVVDNWGHDEFTVNELILKRRKARRAKFEQGFVTGDDITKGKAARAAALSFLQTFCNKWVPKLVKGDDRSSLVKGEYRHAPGMKEIRPKDSGADSEEAFEELWEYADEGIQKMLGGELVLPGLMGQRLREIRAAVAAESKGTLFELIAPELRKARIEYTDYVEGDRDELGAYERFHMQMKVDGSENEAYSTAAIIAEMTMN